MHDEKVVQALNMLGKRLERIEKRLSSLDSILETAPEAIGAIADSIDDFAQEANATGASIYDRKKSASTLIERATRPAVLQALTDLLDRVESMEEAAKISDLLPGMAAAAIDSIDDMAMRAIEGGIDIPLASRRFGEMLEVALWGLQSKELSEIVSVESIRSLATALKSTSRETSFKRKPMSFWKAMRDPEIRRTLDFGFRFAKRIGAHLSKVPAENTLKEKN